MGSARLLHAPLCNRLPSRFYPAVCASACFWLLVQHLCMFCVVSEPRGNVSRNLTSQARRERGLCALLSAVCLHLRCGRRRRGGARAGTHGARPPGRAPSRLRSGFDARSAALRCRAERERGSGPPFLLKLRFALLFGGSQTWPLVLGDRCGPRSFPKLVKQKTRRPDVTRSQERVCMRRRAMLLQAHCQWLPSRGCS